MKDEELKEKLTPEQYRVMREKGQEKPFTGKYWDHEEEGIYACPACGNELFSSEDKFDSETGWPSFRKLINQKTVEIKGSDVICKECGSDVGDVATDEKGKQYYRANSASLEFEEAEEDEEEEEEEDDKQQNADNKKQVANNKRGGGSRALQNIAMLAGGMAAGAGIAFAAVPMKPSLVCEVPTPSPAAVTTQQPKTQSSAVIPTQGSATVVPRSSSAGTVPTNTAVTPAEPGSSAASADGTLP